MDTLSHIKQKFGLDFSQPSPIDIPNFNRDGMAEMFAELGFTSGAEIGTWMGEYANVLCRANPQSYLYCIDPWLAYSGYNDCIVQARLSNAHQQAKQLLEGRNCELIVATSMEAVTRFDNESLDFVYIDANHDFPHVVEDIHGWLSKVRTGGIISGHDFQTFRDQHYSHVEDAVVGYTKSFRIHPWFVLGTKRKSRKGEIRDRHRSWMWVKC